MTDSDDQNDVVVRDWMAFLALRHLLPNRALRLLVKAVVKAVGDGAELEDLFEQAGTSEVEQWSDIWLLRPRVVESQTRQELQRFVSSLVWQTDETFGLDPRSSRRISEIDQTLAKSVAALGAADLEWPLEQVFDLDDSRWQPTFNMLLRLIQKGQKCRRERDPSDFWSAVERDLEGMPMPLAVLATKHLADLWGDADEWERALSGYERAEKFLDAWSPSPAWSATKSDWISVVIQSRATALETTRGPQAAAGVLLQLLANTRLADAPTFVANASLDAFVVASDPSVQGFDAKDSRVALSISPLLLPRQELSSALRMWLNARHSDSQRLFWGVLRRQLALGGSAEVRTTKGLYARSIFDQLRDLRSVEERPEPFRTAARLLVESMAAEHVSKVAWSNEQVHLYVNKDVVDLVLKSASAFPGSRPGRQSVAVELFKEWTSRVPPERRTLALVMWKHIAGLAVGETDNARQMSALAHRSFEALSDLASKRPEWRKDVATEVIEAIRVRLARGRSIGALRAGLETSEKYVDAFDLGQRAALADWVLDVLQEIEPEKEIWPVVRPALRLLIQIGGRLSPDHQGLQEKIRAEVLRYGLREETEVARVFFYLEEMGTEMVRTEANAGLVDDVVRRLRDRTKQTNSSNITETINAIILGHKVCGASLLKEACEALKVVVALVSDGERSIGFPEAYSSILLLLEKQGSLGLDISSILRDLWGQILDVWRAAAERPAIMAPFSFPPPNRPDVTIVHNWAVTTTILGRKVERTAEAEALLRSAAQEPALKEGIGLARATMESDGREGTASIAEEDSATFYSALGRRLVQMETTQDAESARRLCQELVTKCVQFGPRPLDAAVLLAAKRMGLEDIVRESGIDDYETKLRAHGEHVDSLAPILRMFTRA